jgi:succinate dehydrogenase / fumarate reductase flavoprotein subunit
LHNREIVKNKNVVLKSAAAIEAHDVGVYVLIISKSRKADPHTVLARGGINAAPGTIDPEDNWVIHAV